MDMLAGEGIEPVSRVVFILLKTFFIDSSALEAEGISLTNQVGKAS